MHTTLREIKEFNPCDRGWTTLLKYLGKKEADDEPLSLLTILESNGIEDAIWCLRLPSLSPLSEDFCDWCLGFGVKNPLAPFYRSYKGVDRASLCARSMGQYFVWPEHKRLQERKLLTLLGACYVGRMT